MLMDFIGKMGTGKTLGATLYAFEFAKQNPKAKIYANYKIKLKNAIYTPFMFLPFSKLSNCLIICDDFHTLRNLQSFIGVIVNLSRKKDISIIITAQYYTQIPKQIRTLVDLSVRTQYRQTFIIIT